LVIGVLTVAGLLVLGLSGAVLVLRPDFEGSQSAELAPAPSGAPAPSLDALLEAARRRHPGFVVTSLSLPGGDAAARVGMLDTTGGALEVLVDPRSGRIAGSHWAERSPLHALRLLHTELYLGTRGRTVVSRAERVPPRRWRERPSEPCREPASPHFGFCPALSWR